MRTDETMVSAIRVDDLVVISDGGTLTLRCIKCNAPTSGPPIRFTFVDSEVGGVPRGIFSALIHFSSRRVGCVNISLCRRHRFLRFLARWGCPLLVAVGFAVGLFAVLAFPKPPDE